FEQLKRDGKILCWGVSNFDVSDLEEAWEIAGDGRLACNQVLYHLEERAIEHAVIPWCERRGVAVVGYSPFGHDRFPGLRTKGGKGPPGNAAGRGGASRPIARRCLGRQPPRFTPPQASKS